MNEFDRLARVIYINLEPDELRSLTTRLQIPYQAIKADAHRETTINLVNYCDRSGRLSELMGVLYEVKSDIEWQQDNILDSQSTSETSSLAADVGSPETKVISHVIQEQATMQESNPSRFVKTYGMLIVGVIAAVATIIAATSYIRGGETDAVKLSLTATVEAEGKATDIARAVAATSEALGTQIAAQSADSSTGEAETVEVPVTVEVTRVESVLTTPTPVASCQVPNLIGFDQSAINQSLANLGLNAVLLSEFSESIVAGSIISQQPQPDEILEPCEGDIIFTISAGIPPIPTDVPTTTPTIEPSATPTVTPIPNPFTTQRGAVTYNFVESYYEGGELFLWFTAFNEGPDESYCIRFSSFLIDSNGNERQQEDRITGGTRGGLDCKWFEAPNQVTTRFGIVFRVTPEQESIQLVEILIQSVGSVQFRNVPIPYNAGA